MRVSIPWRMVAALFMGLSFGVSGLVSTSAATAAAPPSKATASPAADAGLKIVEFGGRTFEGAPALALTLSLPMDARERVGDFIQVWEMPPRAGEAQVKQDGDEDEYGNEAPTRRDASVSTAEKDLALDGGKPVKGAWVVGDNPRLLFFPNIRPQTRYVVRVKTGLKAGDGQALAKPASYSVLTAAVTPAYYFASRGMVLPAKQNGGLPVVTINVPEVDIQFLRVKADQLPRFLDKVISAPKPKNRAKRQNYDDYDYGEDGNEGYDWRATDLKGAVNNWSLDALHTLTESVFSGRFLAEKKANKRSVTFIPVEDIKDLRTPGIYVAVMSQPNRFRHEYQVTYFYVSDLGLSLRLFASGADAYVSSLSSAHAAAGVEVAWLDENAKVLSRASTDANGRAAFAERPTGAKVVMARQGQQVSLVALKEPALDLSEFDIGGIPGRAVRLFAYSGRDLYRPGESLDISVLARDADGRSIATQPIEAKLKRPDGKDEFTETWRPSDPFAGYYQQRISLPADAPTGFWTLELRSDPADKRPTTVYRIGVEEFLPERMKLELSSKQAHLGASDTLVINIKGSYLYGAPAAGNKLLGVATFERQKNPLAQKLPGFEFGDSGEDSQRSRVELTENQLNDAGTLALDVDLAPAQGKRSPYTVRTTVSLLESGGRPVVRNFERVVWPADVLVGVRPLFAGDYAREGSVAPFEVIRADASGKLWGANALPVRLYRENRDYYWQFDDGRGWHSGYSESDELVDTASVSLPANGRGKIALPVKYGRYRLEIFDPQTKQTSKYRFYAGWSARGDETQGQRPDRVALKLDKPAYTEGETAKLTITPPHNGEALVTVEGDKTLWVKRLNVVLTGTTLDIPVDKAWKRHDLYISVAVLRPGSEGEKVTPARALGLTHLPLQRNDRKLAVTLEAPKRITPDSHLKVRVKVAGLKDQAAQVTLSAVDLGILNITRFATPDPHGHFFGKQRYGVDQYDVYGRLIEKMGGRKGRLKYGGDTTPNATRSLPPKVRLVDLFSGPVRLNAQGEAEISLNVPDFNGSLRLMAVAATADRFGNAEAETVVAAPLVAELLTPRFLTLGDSATVGLDLNNLSGTDQSYKIKLSSPDGLKIQGAERELSLKNQQKQTLRFAVEAGTALGLAEVKVQISGNAGFTLERRFALQVQAATPEQHVLKRFMVQPGETLDVREADLAGLLRHTVQAQVVISNRAPIDVRDAVQGLLTYPYGCTEQTTSTAYPHVLVDEDGAKLFGLKPYTRAQRTEMLDKAMARLATMQAPNGGFSLWGNVSEYQYWLSAYVGNFLLDAREQNFAVPEAMQKNASQFLLKYLQEGVAGLPSGTVAYNENGWQDYRYGGSGRFGVLAYGAYVLAREARAPLSTLRQMYEVRAQAHSGLALVHLGLALKLMGDEGRAQTVLAEGVKKTRLNGYWWGDYGSPLRDAALSYTLLERHKVRVDGKDNLIGYAADALNKNRYTSTQEKLALFLLGRSVGTNAEPGTPWGAEFSARGKPEALLGQGSLTRPVAADALAAGVRIKNTHKERLFVQLGMAGFPAKMPPTRNDVIALKRELFDGTGNPLRGRTLKVGDSVIVRIQVDPRSRVTHGMVVDKIAAGLEIENLNIAQGEGMGSVTIDGVNPGDAMKDPRIQHVEFRDDRFVAAARLHGRLSLFYRARVVTPGQFVFPPVYAEDMYRPDVYGLNADDTTLTVTESRAGAAGTYPVVPAAQRR